MAGGLRLAFVLWTGALGGAEQFTAALANEMTIAEVEPTVVFLGPHRPLSTSLEMHGIPYRTLGLARGSHVLRHPRRFARLVGASGSDGAILDSSGYVAAALRTGGYRGLVVSVEHGVLVQTPTLSRWKRVVRSSDQTMCSWAPDIGVAVSDFVLSALLTHSHPRRVTRIHNGIDLRVFRPAPRPTSSSENVFSIGWAGRMVPGKGVSELLRAVSILLREVPVEVRLAGDGPDRGALEDLAEHLGLAPHVFFAGTSLDVTPFWAECDVGAFPTNQWIESFGLAAVEAMACGRPVVASRSGGLEEVVNDGRTGILVEPGDIEGLAAALKRYALDASLRDKHGREAREDCERRFDIKETAAHYLALFES